MDNSLGLVKENQDSDILYIVIPAYNEEENITEVLEEWHPVIEKHSAMGMSRIVIVDDGSTDKTRVKACEFASKKKQIEIISKENGGHGQAVLFGYRYALKQRADYIFQTDCDGHTSAAYFEAFWMQRKRFDVVIGNRHIREDGLGRVIVAKIVILLLAVSLGVDVQDANTPYRLMGARALGEGLEYIDKDETIPNIMLTAIFKRKRYKVLFKDVRFKARMAGKNSIDTWEIIRIGMCALKRFRKLDRRLRAEGL